MGARCYCVEANERFTFWVEDVEPEYEPSVAAAYFERVAPATYRKEYPATVEDKELISANFSRLGEAMFRGEGRWESALRIVASRCTDAYVRWYITGSVSEAVRGVAISPHDVDVVVHVSDFFRLKALFPDCLIEPFVDNEGTWAVRYFGRLCVEQVMVDVAADESRNEERHAYEDVLWNGTILKVEPLSVRYATERERGRLERVHAIEAYLQTLDT